MRARNIRLQLQAEAKSITLATVETDLTKTNELIANAEEYMSAIDSELTWFNSEFDGDLTLIKSYESKLEQLKSMDSQIKEMAKENTTVSSARAQEILLEEYNPMVTEMGQIIREFNELQAQIADDGKPEIPDAAGGHPGHCSDCFRGRNGSDSDSFHCRSCTGDTERHEGYRRRKSGDGGALRIRG